VQNGCLDGGGQLSFESESPGKKNSGLAGSAQGGSDHLVGRKDREGLELGLCESKVPLGRNTGGDPTGGGFLAGSEGVNGTLKT